jgi:hypothetical protein
MIRLLGLNRGYMPGETLDFQYSIKDIPIATILAIETSVLWVTEGKGNEDLGVHCFERITGDSITSHDWKQPKPIRIGLPDCPLSYEGKLLKIRWCIRVRVYLDDGTELVAQEPFYLGTLTREI